MRLRVEKWGVLGWTTSVRTSIMVPQKCLYRPKLGSTSKDLPPKYGTSHQDSVECFSSTDEFGNNITYSNYNNENNLVFSMPGLGLVNSNFGGE